MYRELSTKLDGLTRMNEPDYVVKDGVIEEPSFDPYSRHVREHTRFAHAPTAAELAVEEARNAARSGPVYIVREAQK